ncbi:MAG: helix-turn-helix domain-containing protein [Aeromicrobium erythreum]
MSRDRVQAIVDRFAAELGRSVVVNDPDVRMLFASPHFGDEDPVRIRAMLNRDAGGEAIGFLLSSGISRWTRPGRVPGSSELGLHARAGVPIRSRGAVIGMILVIDADGTVTDAELDRIGEVADELAPLLLDPTADDAVEAVVTAALGRDPVARVGALADLGAAGHRPGSGPVRVVTVTTTEHGDRDLATVALRHALVSARSRSRGDVLVAVDGLRGHLVRLGPDGRALDDVVAEARALVDGVREVVGDAPVVTAGAGSSVPDLATAWVSARQAGLAADVARRRGDGPVAAWERSGPAALLVRVPTDELDVTAVPEALRRLAAADPSGRLLETLRAFLDHAGAGPAAAGALFIHRTTLYYRLDRIREITGVDLDDGTLRLELHLGLLVADLLRADGVDPFAPLSQG